LSLLLAVRQARCRFPCLQPLHGEKSSVTNKLLSLGAQPSPPRAEPCEPHTPSRLGPPLPGCRWPVARTSAPASPQRFLVFTSPSSQTIFRQRPPLKVDYAVRCVSPCTAHDPVQVSYLLGMCQKPQMFLSQQQQKELGVCTQLKTMSAVDFLANWFHFIAKR